ncbi:hypothetical protein M427DRAFT_67474 [Gonapodya prolifera JEL478]|uniref:Uncharacterized protein n=1 Tax=Gonapodya prolifera (strain JEL478) TaxID=1344416 RepID=A0A139AQ37_GONPJ|nr:hypothetical protein M427DRAFT_67474 [Gonapodya prolifera JEL478]|eukprot:KXS18860.1 hypothetical protein M427DRAFT_67474 [Gonapodya prolifera JEL478]
MVVLVPVVDGFFSLMLVARAMSLVIKLWGGKIALDKGALERHSSAASTVVQSTFSIRCLIGVRTSVVRAILAYSPSDLKLVLGSALISTIAGLLVGVPIYVLAPDYSQEYGCNIASVVHLPNYGLAGCSMGITIVLAGCLIGIQDLLMLAVVGTPFVLCIYLFRIGILPDSVNETFSATYFIIMTSLWMLFCTVLVPIGMALRSKNAKHGTSVRGNMDFERFTRAVMEKESALWQTLKEFAVREFCVELVSFIDAHNNLMTQAHKHMPSPADTTSLTWRAWAGAEGGRTAVPEAVIKEFRVVYEDYVVQGARNEVNVGGAASRRVAEAFNTGAITLGVFDEIRAEVLTVIFDNLWVKSQYGRQ